MHSRNNRLRHRSRSSLPSTVVSILMRSWPTAWREMCRIAPIVILSSAMWPLPSIAAAQATRAEVIANQKAAKANQVTPVARAKGDRIITDGLKLLYPAPPAVRPTFGGFRPGAGFGPGLEYLRPVGRGLWTVKGGWSVKNFKLAESALDLPDFIAGETIDLQLHAQWQDAPRLTFFGLGTDSAASRKVSYALRSTEVGLLASMEPLRRIKVGGSVHYLDVRSGAGAGSFPSIETTFSPLTAPGLDSRPSWLHGGAFVAFDSRQSPGYTRRGAFYQVAYHGYRAREGQPFSFRRLDVDLRQFIPILNENWIIALEGRAQLTDKDHDQTIPYFMLPSLGGGDSLRGYDQYRFTDRHSLLLRSELRWTPSSLLDMALFVDQGKVASRRQDLDLHDMRRGVGIGARFHGPGFTALRLEVAHGSEGWRYHIAQSASF